MSLRGSSIYNLFYKSLVVFEKDMNLMPEKVVREINLSEDVTLDKSTINLLAYADADIAFLGIAEKMIKRMGNKLIKVAEKVGLIVNDEKTEYIIVSQRNIQGYLMHRGGRT